MTYHIKSSHHISEEHTKKLNTGKLYIG